MKPHAYKTEAIVLKRDSFSETDRLVTLLSPRYGKLRCIAKGVKRIHSRKAPHLELFNVVSAFIAQGKTLDVMLEVSTVKTFAGIRGDLLKLAYAYKAVEHLDRLCAEGVANDQLFRLLGSALLQIDQASAHKLSHISENFTHNLLWNLGFLPPGKTLSGASLGRFLYEILERVPKSERFLSIVYRS